MQAVTSFIDVVYGRIIALTVGFLRHVRDTFSLVPTDMTRDFQSELEQEHADDTDQTPTFKTVSEILRTKPIAQTTHPADTTSRSMIMYTSNADVPLYTNPTIEFDTQLDTIPYGEMLMVLDAKGRFYKVAWNERIGWILKDDVVDRSAHAYPEFSIGKENLAHDANTIHIRAMLGDMFSATRAELPLQAGEYVSYKLLKKNIRISWPHVRPRTPGRWHQILRGVPNVHIGVMPKVGAIIEYVQDDDVGHVAVVESVLPDDTLVLSEANYPDSGRYNERTLTKEEWKELRPVFIEVSA
jgi:hypothetical protein